jgi:hypothetical protein
VRHRKPEWKLVTEYGVASYACGLRAGDRVALKKPLVMHNHEGKPTGKTYPAGEVWTVLTGSRQDPGVVWFRQADGERHTWDDDAAQIDEWFRRPGPAE